MNDSFRWSGDKKDFWKLLGYMQKTATIEQKAAARVAKTIEHYTQLRLPTANLTNIKCQHDDNSAFFGRMAAQLEAALDYHTGVLNSANTDGS